MAQVQTGYGYVEKRRRGRGGRRGCRPVGRWHERRRGAITINTQAAASCRPASSWRRGMRSVGFIRRGMEARGG